jgi:hypothetical protein
MNILWAKQHEEDGMTLALNLERKAQAAAVVHSHGVPHRRIEEWKYSDLKSALGEAGIGAVAAQWLVGNLPSGVEIFDLARNSPPDWVSAHLGMGSGNVMSAASLALSAGGGRFGCPPM